MTFLRRFFPMFFVIPEPNFAAINHRSHWHENVSRGRWVG